MTYKKIKSTIAMSVEHVICRVKNVPLEHFRHSSIDLVDQFTFLAKAKRRSGL
jgi:hypothetical protein